MRHRPRCSVLKSGSMAIEQLAAGGVAGAQLQFLLLLLHRGPLSSQFFISSAFPQLTSAAIVRIFTHCIATHN